MELQKFLPPLASLLRTHFLKRELEQLLKELGMTKEDGINFRVANGLKNVDSVQVSQWCRKLWLKIIHKGHASF